MNNLSVSKVTYLQLAASYAPAWGFGGTVRVLYDYAQWAAEKYETVAVITSDINHDYTVLNDKSDLYGKVNVYRVPMLCHKLSRKNVNILSIKMFSRAVSIIKNSSGNVVIHFGELRGSVPIYVVILKKMFPTKVRVVYSSFGHLHTKKSKLRDIFDYFFLGSILSNIDTVLAQNEHEASCYEEMSLKASKALKSQVTVFPLHSTVPDYINVDDARSNQHDHQAARIRSKLDISEDAFVLVFLGRLHPEKGIFRAIDAFNKFQKKYEGESFFLIIGKDDGFQSQAEAYIEDLSLNSSVRVINNVYEDRFEYYCASDLFVGFPTIYEETMLSSVEALCCGIPLLVSKEADIPFVESENAGFVIDYTVEEAVRCMLKVSLNKEEFRKQAKAIASKYFLSENAKSVFFKILESNLS